MTIDQQHVRMAEALLFAAEEPLDKATLMRRLPDDVDVDAIMEALGGQYDGHGVQLVQRGGAWAFQTAPDLGYLMSEERDTVRRLSRAAIETLAIIAYHQPITRAEIEEVRGVSLSKGTLDVLFESGWIKLRGRRRTPGRPVTYGTTDDFLGHFGLESVQDLPGLDELRATGLLNATPPPTVPRPVDAQGESAGQDDDVDESETDLEPDTDLEPETDVEAAASEDDAGGDHEDAEDRADNVRSI